MTVVHHPVYGPGQIVESETVRGRTRHKVAGAGWALWMDATEVSKRTGGSTQSNGPAHYDFLPPAHPDEAPLWMLEREEPLDRDSKRERYERGLDRDAAYYANTTIEPATHVNEDNSTTLPYDPSPQFAPDLWSRQETIPPGEQEIDAHERLSPSDSRTFEHRSPSHEWPGPNPDLFAKGASFEHEAWTFHDDEPGGQFGHWDAYGEHLQHVDEPFHGGPERLVDEQSHYENDPAYLKHMYGSMSAGLSDKYAAIPGVPRDRDHPITRFIDNPIAEITRVGSYMASFHDADTEDYARMVEADRQLRTAAWSDVRSKAMRLRREGRVDVHQVTRQQIFATVKGDHGVYDVRIVKGGAHGGLGQQSIDAWHCDCDWGSWAFKRRVSYVGRLCSHGYACYLEMQSKHLRENGPRKGDILELGPGVKQRRPVKHRSRPYGRGAARVAGIVEDFKSYCDDSNHGHVDQQAADDFLTLAGPDAFSADEVDKVYDYVNNNATTVGERDFDVDYTANPDDVVKEGARYAEVLHSQPQSLTPDLVVVPPGDGEKFVDLERDERTTTGPDGIVRKGGEMPDFKGRSRQTLDSARPFDDEETEHDPIVHFSHIDALGNPYHRRTADWLDDPIGSFTDVISNPLQALGFPGGPSLPEAGAALDGGSPSGGGGGKPPASSDASGAAKNLLPPAGPNAGSALYDTMGGSGGLAGKGGDWGTGPGHGGAGYQNDGSWAKSNETSHIPGGDYTVKPGDTLGDIAGRAGVDAGQLKAPSGNADLIRPGETINIPKSAPAAPPPTAPGVGAGSSASSSPAPTLGSGGGLSTLMGPGLAHGSLYRYADTSDQDAGTDILRNLPLSGAPAAAAPAAPGAAPASPSSGIPGANAATSGASAASSAAAAPHTPTAPGAAPASSAAAAPGGAAPGGPPGAAPASAAVPPPPDPNRQPPGSGSSSNSSNPDMSGLAIAESMIPMVGEIAAPLAEGAGLIGSELAGSGALKGVGNEIGSGLSSGLSGLGSGLSSGLSGLGKGLSGLGGGLHLRGHLSKIATGDLLNQLRTLSDTPLSDDLGEMDKRNDKAVELIEELRDRGADVALMVASWRAAKDENIPPGASFEAPGGGDWADLPFCVDEQTEIFTDRGWRQYPQVQPGTSVLTLNHDSGLSEWQPVERINVFEGPHEMLSVESKTHSSLTTLNHRWPVVREGYVSQNQRGWTTSDTHSSHDHVPVAAECADLPTEAKYTDALVEAVAWFWTEGNIERLRDGSPCRAAKLTQSLRVNADKCDMIASALTRLFGPESSEFPRRGGVGRTVEGQSGKHNVYRNRQGTYYVQVMCDGRKHHGGTFATLPEAEAAAKALRGRISTRNDAAPRWRRVVEGDNMRFFLNAEAGQLLQELAPNRVPTHEFLFSLTKAQLMLFIETSMLGDGHTRVRSGERMLSQKDPAAAEAFQFACILAGLPTSIATNPTMPNYGYGMTGVRIRKQRRFRLARGRHERVTLDGVVWCPTTGNSTWLARRNGKVYFTGNSGSGPDPKYWWGTSQDYVDDHERDRFQDVTEGDGRTKYTNPGKRAPQRPKQAFMGELPNDAGSVAAKPPTPTDTGASGGFNAGANVTDHAQSPVQVVTRSAGIVRQRDQLRAGMIAPGDRRPVRTAAGPDTYGGDDVVRQFQANIENTALGGGESVGGSFSDADIAANARAFLQKTAGRKYSPSEQRELEQESHHLGARNMPTEDDLAGTHYLS